MGSIDSAINVIKSKLYLKTSVKSAERKVHTNDLIRPFSHLHQPKHECDTSNMVKTDPPQQNVDTKSQSNDLQVSIASTKVKICTWGVTSPCTHLHEVGYSCNTLYVVQVGCPCINGNMKDLKSSV